MSTVIRPRPGSAPRAGVTRPKRAAMAPAPEAPPLAPGAEARPRADAPFTKSARAEVFKFWLQRNGISFDRLRALVAVREAGSLIRAAAGNEVRAGQFSRQIAELEACFEFRLTERQGGKLVLNAAGQQLAGFAADFFRQLEDFVRGGSGEARMFTIGAGESLLQWVVTPKLGALQRQLDDASFRLRNLQNSEIVRGLEELTLDFGLVRRRSLRRPLVGATLGLVDYQLCVPAALLHRHGDEDVFSLLETLPLAVHLETAYIQHELESAARREGRGLNIRLRCDTFPSALAALQTGAYATLMLRVPGTAGLPDGVREFPIPYLEKANREVCLAWNPRLLKMRPEAEALRKRLLKELGWAAI